MYACNDEARSLVSIVVGLPYNCWKAVESMRFIPMCLMTYVHGYPFCERRLRCLFRTSSKGAVDPLREVLLLVLRPGTAMVFHEKFLDSAKLC